MAAASACDRTRLSSRVAGMPTHLPARARARQYRFHSACGEDAAYNGLSSPGAIALHCRSDSICLRAHTHTKRINRFAACARLGCNATL